MDHECQTYGAGSLGGAWGSLPRLEFAGFMCMGKMLAKSVSRQKSLNTAHDHLLSIVEHSRWQGDSKHFASIG